MYRDIRELYREVMSCDKCALSKTRRNIVFGEGDIKADIMFIGEGPGGEEDRIGRPFVGRAGRLLDELIASIGMKREQIYIANIVKCRPPGNRDPLPKEREQCVGYLRAQVAFIRPKIIVCLGRIAAQTIISKGLSITRERGNWTKRKSFYILPTYHPAAVLRNDMLKKDAYADFQSILEKYKEIGESV